MLGQAERRMQRGCVGRQRWGRLNAAAGTVGVADQPHREE
jgi:hypothetical protein